MKKKRMLSLILVFVLLLGSIFPNLVYAEKEAFDWEDTTYLAGSLDEKQIFQASDSIDEPRAIASMSKIMTYLVVKDSCEEGLYSLDKDVIVTDDAYKFSAPGNSRMDLKVGEIISVEDLLKGLMVVSANDAAVALAINDRGTEEDFVKKMNDKVQELGLSNSKFVNPHGLSENDSYNQMSARDLYTLVLHIVNKYPEVLDYSEMSSLSMPERNFEKEATGGLLLTIPGYMGLKTGYTQNAGFCFTGVFDLSKYDTSKDFNIITVVMHAQSEEDRYEKTSELVAEVSKNFHKEVVVDNTKPIDIITDNSLEVNEVELYPKEDLSLIIGNDEKIKIDLEYDLPEDKYEKNTDYGDIIVSNAEGEITRIDLITNRNIGKASFITRLARAFSNAFSYLSLMFFA